MTTSLNIALALCPAFRCYKADAHGNWDNPVFLVWFFAPFLVFAFSSLFMCDTERIVHAVRRHPNSQIRRVFYFYRPAKHVGGDLNPRRACGFVRNSHDIPFDQAFTTHFRIDADIIRFTSPEHRRM